MYKHRTLLLLAFTGAAASANAQLENGSFETGGEQWYDPCQGAVYLPGGAPSGGSTYARLPLFHEGSTCDLNTQGRIYQKMPAIQNGDTVTVHYWYRGLANLTVNQPLVHLNGLLGYVHGTGELLTHNPEVWIHGPVPMQWQAGGATIIWVLEPGDTAVVALGGYGEDGVQGTIDLDRVEVVIEHLILGIPPDAIADATVLYPDPVQDHLSIRTAEPLTHVLLYTADGKLVNAYGPVNDLDLGALPPGAYLLDLRTVGGRVVRRVIKSK